MAPRTTAFITDGNPSASDGGGAAGSTGTEYAIIVSEPAGEALPVVFDSPHSGSINPTDFGAALPMTALREGEDRFVDELFALVSEHGATLIAAPVSRTYIDLNRVLEDLDAEMLAEPWPEPLRQSGSTLRGVGLIWRYLTPDKPLYDRLLGKAEVEARIAGFWRPYHETLQARLDEAYRRHGAYWHVNCHSMWSVGRALAPDPGRRRADFVLSDLDGTSCAPAFIELARSVLTSLGYTVALNDPFKGGAIVARHGDPARRRHSLQIEIARRLYMDEDTLEPHAGLETVRSHLGVLAGEICMHARAATAD